MHFNLQLKNKTIPKLDKVRSCLAERGDFEVSPYLKDFSHENIFLFIKATVWVIKTDQVCHIWSDFNLLTRVGLPGVWNTEKKMVVFKLVVKH